MQVHIRHGLHRRNDGRRAEAALCRRPALGPVGDVKSCAKFGDLLFEPLISRQKTIGRIDDDRAPQATPHRLDMAYLVEGLRLAAGRLIAS
jgi:hypothetical protein